MNNKNEILVPQGVIDKWQMIVDLLAEIMHVTAALIMRIEDPYIKVFLSSQTDKNPYKVGDGERLHGSGFYCEQVIKDKKRLIIPNALKDKAWSKNPDIKLGLISYIGFPIFWPDGEVFGTICALDNKENQYNVTYEKLINQLKEIIESHLALLCVEDVLTRTNEALKNKIAEVEKLNNIFIGRELRMKELKDEIARLEAALKQK